LLFSAQGSLHLVDLLLYPRRWRKWLELCLPASAPFSFRGTKTIECAGSLEIKDGMTLFYSNLYRCCIDPALPSSFSRCGRSRTIHLSRFWVVFRRSPRTRSGRPDRMDGTDPAATPSTQLSIASCQLATSVLLPLDRSPEGDGIGRQSKPEPEVTATDPEQRKG